MEDFKDVMLSEPPQRYTNASSAPMTSNALSLESYKGILLCDRPADVRAARYGSSQQAFLPPGNTDMDRGNGNLGLPPSLETRARNAMNRATRGDTQNRSRNTALSRHRKWLQSFATEMKKMQEEKTEAQIRQTVREATLRDREANKRREGVAPSAADSTAAVAAPSTPPEPKSSPAAAAAPKTKKAGKSKPKWAMTEEEAEDAEFADARDLVDFAAELDFDSFIKDFEVQEAIAIMRDRVKEIAAEKGIDLETARRARRKADDEDDDDDTASVATTSTTTREIRRAVKKASKARADGDEAEDGSRPGWDDSTSTTIRKALEGDAQARGACAADQRRAAQGALEDVDGPPPGGRRARDERRQDAAAGRAAVGVCGDPAPRGHDRRGSDGRARHGRPSAPKARADGDAAQQDHGAEPAVPLPVPEHLSGARPGNVCIATTSSHLPHTTLATKPR